MIAPYECKNVLIQGVTLTNSQVGQLILYFVIM